MQTHRCGPPSKVSAPACFSVSSLPRDGSCSDTGHRVGDHDRVEGQDQVGEMCVETGMKQTHHPLLWGPDTSSVWI